MRRRKFLMLLGGMAIACPLETTAQQAGGMRRIAVLVGGSENDPAVQARIGFFRKGLAEKQWIEGRNIRMDIRWSGADAVRGQAYARELVGLAPDVILVSNTPTARALKQATDSIPVVFTSLADPIADGIVKSLSKPSGNFTGFTSFNAAIAGKWLQLLKEISPRIDRVAVVYNPHTAPHAIFLPVMRALAPQIGISLVDAPVADRSAIEEVMGRLTAAPGGGLILMPDVFTTQHREFIFALSNANRVPTVSPLRTYATAGSLISYGSNFDDLFSRAAVYVDRILRGEKPGDLPVQEPTRYELVVNLKTAKAVGLELPPSLLATADEIIE